LDCLKYLTSILSEGKLMVMTYHNAERCYSSSLFFNLFFLFKQSRI